MKTSRWVGLGVAGLVAVLAGCFDRDLTDIEPNVQTGVDIKIDQIGVVRVDIVVLVDNSGSMAQEQVQLTERFPELIRELVDPPDTDGDTRPDHPPVEDLRIGVISSDMGTMGFTVPTCRDSAAGDDGCFRHTPSPLISDCRATYDRFLSRSDETYSPDDMAHDFACIAMLGTSGCGFEQQFKAMEKALAHNAGAGRCTEGFVRPDSLLGLIFVTDEEDCSVLPAHPEMFDPTRNADLGPLNIRCFQNKWFVETVDEYYGRFRALRPDRPDSIVMGMIVGVPEGARACNGDGDHLSGCLSVPAMVETPDATGQALVPSCNTDMGTAYPPVRFVQLAERWGSDAYVGSICQEDWTGPLSAITSKIIDKLPSTCFPRALSTLADNACLADCRVIERLSDVRDCEPDPACPQDGCPPADAENLVAIVPCVNPTTGETCEPLKRDLGLITTPAGITHRQCLVRQATRVDEDPDANVVRCSAPSQLGWFYQPVNSNGPGDPPCPQVVFARGESGSLIDVGGTAYLRCLSFLCRPERQCGPAATPDSICCADGRVCRSGTCEPE